MFKLLIVDDEFNTRKGIIARVPFGEMGISEVYEADDGLNGFNAFLDVNPDIILSDVKMPRMDGIEMVMNIKKQTSLCKVIFMSGYSDKEYLKSAIELNALNYIEKPINMNELTKALTASVSLCIEDRKKIQAENDAKILVSKSSRLLKNDLALQLINKNINSDLIKSNSSTVSLEIPDDGIFVTMMLDLYNFYDGDSIQSASFVDTFNKIFEGLRDVTELEGLWTAKSGSSIVLIFFANKSKMHLFSTRKLDSVCNFILDELNTKYSILMSIGKIVTGMNYIHESYFTSVLALQRAFFGGFGTIVNYNSCNMENQPYQFSENTLKEFTELLLKEDHINAEFLIKRTTTEIKCFSTTLVNTCKDFYYKFIIEMNNAAALKGFELLEDSLANIWTTFLEFHTLQSMESFITNSLNTYFEKLNYKKNKAGIIVNILDYITKHYHEEHLTLGYISEKVNLSPAYISNIFKKSTGKTFVKYVNEYRIEKAKELLKDKKLKISDIALKVGCEDNNYFTKIFRKACGITPSEYREKLIK